jgi:2-polyprenyl-6-hydroxyphenyl methylase/3-demethylubiquinone-9 3-methyltransferase
MKSRSFAFGKNWQRYIDDYLSSEQLDEAKQSFIDFLGGNKIKGKSFLDVGCGSGLFSLAAYQLGASKVVSFDIDPDSVKCCEYLREREGNPPNWKILQGSVLETGFMHGLGTYDVVYSWGVLHHTGKMWQAIENTSKLVADQGLLYIAIYNKADCLGFYPDGRFGPSGFWAKEKRLYCSVPPLVQSFIDYSVMFTLITMYILTLKNPIKKIREHKKFRGMSWKIDIKDWLGGYPYEYASVSEVFAFLKQLGFSLQNITCNNGLMNNEYLFVKA